MAESKPYFKRLPREDVIQLALLFLDLVDDSNVTIQQLVSYDDANYLLTFTGAGRGLQAVHNCCHLGAADRY